MSAKHSRAGERERIQQQLRTADLSSDLPYDLRWAVRVLHGEEVAPPELLRTEVLQALAEELVERKGTETLDRLARLDHREVAKAARTGLHRLRSKKVEIAVPPPTEVKAGTGQLDTTGSLFGLMTAYDSRRQRMVWLTQDSTRGIVIHQARISVEHGLLAFDSWRSSRRKFKELAGRVREHLASVETEVDVARWYIEDAVQRSQRSKHGVPESFASVSQMLGPPPGGEHPALALEPANASPAALLELYQLRELEHWYPERDYVRQWTLRLEEVSVSRIVVDEQQRQAQLASTLERAVAEYFTAERVGVCRRVLLDTSHLFAIGGQRERAALVRAAADLYLLDLERLVVHPFPRHFVERMLAPRTEAAARPQEVALESGLILPGQAEP